MNWKEAKQHLLEDEETRKAYERPDVVFWISKKWTDFRIWLADRKDKNE